MSLYRITEDYISFEIAKLLKEKGFKETSNTIGTYNDNGVFYLYKHENGYNHNHLSSWYSAPTLQMAMKWLREVQGINIYARAVWKDVEVQYGNWEPAVVGYNWFVESLLDETYSKMSNEEYNSYEEACEAAIKYCLENLI